MHAKQRTNQNYPSVLMKSFITVGTGSLGESDTKLHVEIALINYTYWYLLSLPRPVLTGISVIVSHRVF